MRDASPVVVWLWILTLSLAVLERFSVVTLAFILYSVYSLIQRDPDTRPKLVEFGLTCLPLSFVLLGGLIRLEDDSGWALLASMGAGGLAVCIGMVSAHSFAPRHSDQIAWMVAGLSLLVALDALWGVVPGNSGGRYASSYLAIVATFVLLAPAQRNLLRGSAGACALAAVLVSGSRMAAGVIAVAMVFSFGKLARNRPKIVVPVAVGAVIAMAVVAVLRWDDLYERVFVGDRAIKIGGLHFNSSGRAAIWPRLWDVAMEKPWFGHGLGYSTEVSSAIWGQAHPHNEVLRVLIDVGFVGLLALALPVAWLTVQVWRSRPDSHGSLGVLVACMAFSMTDNILIYGVWMIAGGLLIGTAIDPRSTASMRAQGTVAQRSSQVAEG